MGHIKGLDGIRALSVVLVVVAHSGFNKIVPGGFGVTVFFFLSGFLITTLLQKEFERKNEISYLNFIIRRVLRIFVPFYFVYLLLLLLNLFGLYPASFTLDGVLSQLLFYTNYYKIYGDSEHLLNGTGVIWSLAVEEHFYIIFPLLFIYFVKKNISYLFYFSIFLCFVILFWRLFLSFYITDSARFYLATDTRFDSILYGVILSLFMYKNKMFKIITDNRLNKFDFFVISLSIVLLLFSFLYRDEVFRNVFRYSIQGLSLIPLFYYVVTRPEHYFFSWLNSHILIKVGLFSYMIYLVHVPIITVLKNYLGFEDGIVLLFFTAFLAYYWSLISYKYLERPVLRLKNKFK